MQALTFVGGMPRHFVGERECRDGSEASHLLRRLSKRHPATRATLHYPWGEVVTFEMVGHVVTRLEGTA